MPIDLTSFDLADMASLGSEVRDCAEGAGGLQFAAQAVAKMIDHQLRTADCKAEGVDDHALALVRIYLTRAASQLDEVQRSFADRLAGAALDDSTQCLTLIGSSGRKPDWCETHRSRGHIAIPLVSLESVGQLPMVWKLFQQLGVDMTALLQRELHRNPTVRREGLGIFHIEQAAGSPWVPAQDFVREEGVKSCVAFGSVLPNGQVLTVLLFSKVPVSSEVAERFKPLSLSVELALLPYLGLGQAQEKEATILAFQRLIKVKDDVVSEWVKELRHAREVAEAQGKLRVELLRNIRHEVRTPMNAVLGMLEMLEQSGNLNDGDLRLAQIAKGSAGGLMHIIENLIEYSDLVTRKRESHSRSFNLRLVLASMIEPMQDQGKSLEWKLAIDPECPQMVMGDEEAVVGIVRQLLENALKFTHSGKVDLVAQVQPDGRLRIEVIDTGIGIERNRRLEMFEGFRQIDGSPRRKHGGNGLGLAIVSELVQQMGGEIHVDSEPGKGSRFSLILPA